MSSTATQRVQVIASTKAAGLVLLGGGCALFDPQERHIGDMPSNIGIIVFRTLTGEKHQGSLIQR